MPSVKKVGSKLDISAIKGKSLDALFLSDIHFLVSDSIVENSHKELLELLATMIDRKIKFRDIYLVGDIVENWYFSAAEVRSRNPQRLNVLFDRLRQLWNEDGSLYFIVGNHDTTAFNQGVSLWLRDYLEKRDWILCEWYQNAHLIAIHGHQGQFGRLSWMLNILGVRIMYTLGRIIPGLFGLAEKLYNRNLNHKATPSDSAVEKYYKKVSAKVHQRNRLLITGHTHEFLCRPEQKILNTGDWLKSRSLIIQQGKVFTGLQLVAGKLERRYSFDLRTAASKNAIS